MSTIKIYFLFPCWMLFKNNSYTPQRCLWKICVLPEKIYMKVSYRPRKGKAWLQLKNSITSFFSVAFQWSCAADLLSFHLPGPSFLLVNQGCEGAGKINQVRPAVAPSTLHCSQNTHASWILLISLGLRFKLMLTLAMQLCLTMVLRSHYLCFSIHLIITCALRQTLVETLLSFTTRQC